MAKVHRIHPCRPGLQPWKRPCPTVNRSSIPTRDDFVKAKAAKPADEKVKHDGGLKAVSIGGIQINNAHLSWRDDQQGSSYVLEKFNLTTGAVQSGKPVRIKLGFVMQDKKAGKSWPFSLAGKLQQDEALVRFHEQTGYRVCSLRISNVFGPGDVPLDVWGARNPAYFQRVADGKEIWIPNDGRALLQPVHVADLARGFAAVAEADVWPGLIYNLSSPQAVTLARYVAVAKDLLGSKSSVRCVPMEEILALGKTSATGLLRSAR